MSYLAMIKDEFFGFGRSYWSMKISHHRWLVHHWRTLTFPIFDATLLKLLFILLLFIAIFLNYLLIVYHSLLLLNSSINSPSRSRWQLLIKLDTNSALISILAYRGTHAHSCRILGNLTPLTILLQFNSVTHVFILRFESQTGLIVTICPRTSQLFKVCDLASIVWNSRDPLISLVSLWEQIFKLFTPLKVLNVKNGLETHWRNFFKRIDSCGLWVLVCLILGISLCNTIVKIFQIWLKSTLQISLKCFHIYKNRNTKRMLTKDLTLRFIDHLLKGFLKVSFEDLMRTSSNLVGLVFPRVFTRLSVPKASITLNSSAPF